MNPELLYVLFFALYAVSLYASFRWGKDRGIIAERIRLTGSSLPRFENPPPPPPLSKRWSRDEVGDGQWVGVDEYLPEESGRYWCYVQEVNDLGISYFQWNCYYDAQEKRFSDSTITQGENVTHWRPLLDPPKEKKTGVPNMPNHPPMPDEEALLKAKAKEAIKKALEGITPEQDEDKACMDLYGAPPRLIVLMRRPGENPYRTSCPPAVTQDQLIDALMDMRLENFLCAHSRSARDGEYLYHKSRKEVAEYLLDMYTITPKAKH